MLVMSEKKHTLCGSDGKESACNAGDLDWILKSGRSPGEGNATHSTILAQRIPWTEETDRLHPGVSKTQRHN